jgi:hypothetical protein
MGVIWEVIFHVKMKVIVYLMEFVNVNLDLMELHV